MKGRTTTVLPVKTGKGKDVAKLAAALATTAPITPAPITPPAADPIPTPDRHKPAKDASYKIFCALRSRAKHDIAGLAIIRALLASASHPDSATLASELKAQADSTPTTLTAVGASLYAASTLAEHHAAIVADRGAMMQGNVSVSDYAALLENKPARADLENALKARGYSVGK